MLTDSQARLLATFDPHRDFDVWKEPESDTFRWLLNDMAYIRPDAQNGPFRFVITESGKIALNEYRQDRADRADRKREKKKDRIHDFVLAAFSALFGVLGTLLVQLLLGVI